MRPPPPTSVELCLGSTSFLTPNRRRVNNHWRLRVEAVDLPPVAPEPDAMPPEAHKETYASSSTATLERSDCAMEGEEDVPWEEDHPPGAAAGGPERGAGVGELAEEEEEGGGSPLARAALEATLFKCGRPGDGDTTLMQGWLQKRSPCLLKHLQVRARARARRAVRARRWTKVDVEWGCAAEGACRASAPPGVMVER